MGGRRLDHSKSRRIGNTFLYLSDKKGKEPIHTKEEKDREREVIRVAMEEFLAKGGQVETLPPATDPYVYHRGLLCTSAIKKPKIGKTEDRAKDFDEIDALLEQKEEEKDSCEEDEPFEGSDTH
jgi:hypothetical protein